MSFIKLINDSFISSSNISTYSSNLNEDINKDIIECRNQLYLIKEQYNEVKSNWKALCNDVEGLSFGNHLIDNGIAESFQQTLTQLKSQYNNLKIKYNELKNKSLTEDFNDLQMTEAVGYDLDSQASFVLDQLNNSNDPFRIAFKYLVPKEGPSQTLAGELIRSIMSIMFYFKQNNELFYLEPGIETCGSFASFLMNNGYWNDFESIVDNEFDGELYYSFLNQIKDRIVNDISNIELLTTPNLTDAKTFNKDWLISRIKNESLTIIPDNILNETT